MFQKLKCVTSKAQRTPLQSYTIKNSLGTCLLQQSKPTAFASKSLMDSETQYGNKGVASHCLCMQVLPHIPLWHPFTVEMDHKPLEMIAIKTKLLHPLTCKKCSSIYNNMMPKLGTGLAVKCSNQMSCLDSQCQAEL